jgi:hypothetical protein
VVFGLLSFKPQLVVVAGPMMILAGQGRFVAGMALTGISLLGISLAVGLEPCLEYLRFATRSGDYLRHGGYDLARSANLIGLVGALFGPTSATVTIARVGSALIVGVLSWLTWQARTNLGLPVKTVCHRKRDRSGERGSARS